MKLSILHIFFVLMCLAGGNQARAYVELNAFYTSDSLNAGTTETSSRMFIEGSFGFPIDSKRRYLIGWSYVVHSVAESGSASTTYAGSQTGPRFIWLLNRDKNWSLGLTYNLITTANYTSGSAPAEKWTGTAIKADLGYSFALSDMVYLGFKLNYSMATYSSKLIGSTDYSNISNGATYIYPSVSFIYYLW